MDKKDIELIRALQDDGIFLTDSPFEAAAGAVGCGVEEVIERVRALRESGVIRRFGAALTPANAGFKSNSMVAWEAKEGKEMEAGQAAALHPRVSHCYIRPPFPGFGYTLYTMVHATGPEDLEAVIREIAEATGLGSWRELRTLKELKKTSPVYFPFREGRGEGVAGERSKEVSI